MRVYSMINSKGNIVKNQFIIEESEKYVFQSYDTIIAEVYKRYDLKPTLDDSCTEYSKTTSKYLYLFLNEYANIDVKKKDIDKDMINPVLFDYTDLNK